MTTAQNEIDAVLDELANLPDGPMVDLEEQRLALMRALELNAGRLPDACARARYVPTGEEHWQEAGAMTLAEISAETAGVAEIIVYPLPLRAEIGENGICVSLRWLWLNEARLSEVEGNLETAAECRREAERYPVTPKMFWPLAWTPNPNGIDDGKRALRELFDIIDSLGGAVEDKSVLDYVYHVDEDDAWKVYAYQWDHGFELSFSSDEPDDASGPFVNIGRLLADLSASLEPGQSTQASEFMRISRRYYPDDELTLWVVDESGRSNEFGVFELIDVREADLQRELHRNDRCDVPGTIAYVPFTDDSRQSVDEDDRLPFSGFVFVGDPSGYAGGGLRCIISDGVTAFQGYER